MGINAREFCDHGYTKIKICPSCLKEKDDQIQSLQSQLSRMEGIVEKAKKIILSIGPGNSHNPKYMGAHCEGFIGGCPCFYNEIFEEIEALSSRAGGESKEEPKHECCQEELCNENKNLQSRLSRMEEVLRWYANEENYDENGVPGKLVCTPSSPNGPAEYDWEPDCGYRAEQALSSRAGGEGKNG